MFHTAGKYWSHEEPTDTGCMASGDNTEKDTNLELWIFMTIDYSHFQGHESI